MDPASLSVPKLFSHFIMGGLKNQVRRRMFPENNS
jgi:hypothetical protein